MLNPRTVEVTATDVSPATDSIERGESGARKIEGHKLVRRHGKESMSNSRAIRVSAHDPIRIVIAKEDRARRTGRVDRKNQRPVAITGETVVDRPAVGIVTDQLVPRVKLVSAAKSRRSRDIDRRDAAAKADEGLKDSGVPKKGADKITGIVYPQHLGARRACHVELSKAAV